MEEVKTVRKYRHFLGATADFKEIMRPQKSETNRKSGDESEIVRRLRKRLRSLKKNKKTEKKEMPMPSHNNALGFAFHRHRTLFLVVMVLLNTLVVNCMKNSGQEFFKNDVPTTELHRHRRHSSRDSLRHARQAYINNVDDDFEPHLITVRLNETNLNVKYDDYGNIGVLNGHSTVLQLFGVNLNNNMTVKLISVAAEYGEKCKMTEIHVMSSPLRIQTGVDGGFTAAMVFDTTKLVVTNDHNKFYFCLSQGENKDYIHQGTGNMASVTVTERFMPLWVMVCCIVVLLCLSGLFSGLNLGLMALDQTELKIVQNTGNEKERHYANMIQPIRKHGNFLLCSLLLGNVLVNNTLTILLDMLTSGMVAIIGATLGIVVFGEIIPQAICSRHGLAVGAYTIWLTKFFMMVTFPLSFPISKLLDYLLGAEIGTVYDKKKLIELLRVTNENNDLEKEEVDIVTGALRYKDKTVKDIMTGVEDVFMLPLDAVLNFDTVSEIRAQGYSRIPIYDKNQKNIVHILFAKDLMFIDPDDNMPVAMVCEFYNNDVNFVFQDTPLNVMFNEFKGGDKGHMAFVQEIKTEGEGDPYYETIGLVTLEDIIEEIIQQEIVDETDIVTDNRTKKRTKKEGWQGKEGNFQPRINADDTRKRTLISPQLALAVFQYLTTSIEPFKAPNLCDTVLKKILMLDVFREIKIKKDTKPEDLIIIQKGKVTDFFILIIEGKVEANIGREELVFESGPFTYFGIQALTNVIGHVDHVASSPVLAHVNRVITSPMEVTHAGISGSRSSLKKAHTQQAFDPTGSNSYISNKRNSCAQLESKQSTPIIPPFIPDYTVKAVTDVLYLRIRRATYIAAAKASKMYKLQGHHDDPEMAEKALDTLLEKVAEANDAIHDNTTHQQHANTPPPHLKSPVKEEESPLLAQKPESVLKTVAGVIGLTGPLTPGHEKKMFPSFANDNDGGSSTNSFPLIDSSIDNFREDNVGGEKQGSSNGPILAGTNVPSSDLHRQRTSSVEEQENKNTGS